MDKPKAILFASDMSPNSQHAYQAACALAKEAQARLIVLHIMEDVAYDQTSLLVCGKSPVGPEAAAQAQASVCDQLRRAVPPVPGIDTEYWVQGGDAGAQIVACAKREKVDLVVMGTHGRKGLARMLLGSVAQQVLLDSPCSVLTLRPASQPLEAGA